MFLDTLGFNHTEVLKMTIEIFIASPMVIESWGYFFYLNCLA